jgi:two-component sensor histidine kinase
MAALAHAHSPAMQNWDADLASLLKAILAPCGREVRGPSIKLAENGAMAFSIATHELATNALNTARYRESTAR